MEQMVRMLCIHCCSFIINKWDYPPIVPMHWHLATTYVLCSRRCITYVGKTFLSPPVESNWKRYKLFINEIEFQNYPAHALYNPIIINKERLPSRRHESLIGSTFVMLENGITARSICIHHTLWQRSCFWRTLQSTYVHCCVLHSLADSTHLFTK